MKETRNLVLTEEEFLNGYDDPSDPDSKYRIDPVIGSLLRNTFPGSIIDRRECESYNDTNDVYLQEGDVKAYLGDMKKVIKDIKRIKRGKRKERNNRAVKITTTHKLPLNYKIKFDNPFKSNLYSDQKHIKLKLEKRHYQLACKYTKYSVFSTAVELAFLENLNDQGKINIGSWGYKTCWFRVEIEDKQYNHIISVLPKTDKFHSYIKESENQNYKETTLDIKVPSRFVKEFKRIEKHPTLKERDNE